MSKQLKIAIQGEQTSFHDMAAQSYFSPEKIEIVECRSFRQLCGDVSAGRADLAVMAIENTLAGSLLPNYSLLQEFPLFIIGETYLPIRHHLMALPGQALEGIHSVRSHPMALHQCSEFLEHHPGMNAVETDDTAGSARQIREEELFGIAAIAGKMAAEFYELEILAEGIENLAQNYTRFLILSANKPELRSDCQKASVNFRLKHRIGALADVLNVFKNNNINLTKIQSIPVPGEPYEYLFLIEMEWEDYCNFEESIAEIERFTIELKILGIYRSGNKSIAAPQ